MRYRFETISRDGGRAPAFTLIELLIVVAIIAILAAIAVPNFLEAQIRAKVSRAQADIRSMATALESYAVDYNTYPANEQGAAVDDYHEGLLGLTTPVAYITALPRSPFGASRYKDEPRPALYEFGSGLAGVRSADEAPFFPNNTWMLECDGPDNYDDTELDHLGLDLLTGQFPWAALPRDASIAEQALSLRYDSTNGTRSSGEIYRTGGSRPPGVFFDLLYAQD